MESKSIDIKKVAELVIGDSRLIGNYPDANVHSEIGIAPATARIAPLEIDTGTKTSICEQAQSDDEEQCTDKTAVPTLIGRDHCN